MAKTLDRGLESREIVLNILTEVLEQGAFVHLVLNQALQKYQYLGKTDRSFTTQTVKGTLEYLIQINEVISRYSKTRIYKMKLLIRSLLRMSVYQILYMDRVSDSAVYSEAVKLAVKCHFSRLEGFVDGVLRAISREKEKLTFDTPSLRYSIPEWIYAMWKKGLGEGRAERITASFLKDKPTWVGCGLYRANRERILAFFKAQRTLVRELPFMESMMAIDRYDYPEGLDAFWEGWIQIQSVTSASVGEIAPSEKGSYIMDVCATPGGKSLRLAGKLRGTRMVEARDLTYQKTALIEENMTRYDVANMETLVRDTLEPDLSAAGKTDIVITNLPYSGLGIIRRGPDIKCNITPEKLEELAGLQREILSVAWQYVKLGGLLYYSTCTADRLESQDNTAWLGERFPLVPVDLTDRFGGLPQESSLKESWIQFLPGVHPYDGFFISVLRRAEGKSDPDGI